MQISICFTSRLCGVHLVTRNISVTYASTHTTGKTSEESRTYTCTVKTSASIGRQRRTPRHTRMAASWSTVAAAATAGRSKSSILITSACKSVVVFKMANAASRTVHIFTPRKKSDFLSKPTISCFLATGAQPQARPRYTKNTSSHRCSRMRTAPRQSTSTHTSTTIMLTKRSTDVDPSLYLSLTQGSSLSFRNLN